MVLGVAEVGGGVVGRAAGEEGVLGVVVEGEAEAVAAGEGHFGGEVVGVEQGLEGVALAGDVVDPAEGAVVRGEGDLGAGRDRAAGEGLIVVGGGRAEQRELAGRAVVGHAAGDDAAVGVINAGGREGSADELLEDLLVALFAGCGRAHLGKGRERAGGGRRGNGKANDVLNGHVSSLSQYVLAMPCTNTGMGTVSLV